MDKIMEVVYKYPDGREVVRYSAPKDSLEWLDLKKQVDRLISRFEKDCPYSYREIDSETHQRRSNCAACNAYRRGVKSRIKLPHTCGL